MNLYIGFVSCISPNFKSYTCYYTNLKQLFFVDNALDGYPFILLVSADNCTQLYKTSVLYSPYFLINLHDVNQFILSKLEKHFCSHTFVVGAIFLIMLIQASCIWNNTLLFKMCWLWKQTFFRHLQSENTNSVHFWNIIFSHSIQMLSLQQVQSAISTLKFNLNKSNIGVNTKLSKKKAEVILHMMKKSYGWSRIGRK